MPRIAAGARVLLEGYNLTLRQGTGIATYARHLAEAISDAGYVTDVLVGSNRRIDSRDPQQAEIVLHDGPRNLNLLHKAYIEFRRMFGAPLGLRAGTLAGLNGVVAGSGTQLQGFGHIHAIPHLVDVERLHFMSRRTRLKVKVTPKPDIFHATRPAPLVVPGAANVYTVHDIVPLRLPQTTADDKAYHLAMIRELARKADHIVTVSEFSRQDIIEFTGIDAKRITNAYQTVAFPAELTAKSVDDVARALAERHGLDYKEYYLFVGALEPKKNIGRLIDAYAAAGVRRPLIISGGLGWMYDGDLERINSERFLTYVRTAEGNFVPRRQVRRFPYLPLQDVVDLIRGARALFYPSIYEGFGLPVAEAMLLGTPVLTSNVSSLPEVAGGSAVLVDPYDVASIAGGIRTLDREDGMLVDLAKRGAEWVQTFSRDAHAERIQAIYRSL